MRNTIYKYFFKEFISFFALILLSLSIIVWVVQSVNYLDFVTEDGHSFGVYFAYSLLNIPKIISRLIPFVFLVSLFFTILQFEKNNELLIFWTAGLNKIRFVNLAIIISILITFLQLFLALNITPLSLEIGRSVLKSSDISLFPSLLKEKKFNDTVTDLTVFVESKSRSGEMSNIFLRDDTTSVDQSKTIIAKKGIIKRKNDQNILVLYDGVMQTERENKKINFLNFDKTEINLSSFTTKTTTFPKFQERPTLALLNCFDSFKNRFNLTNKYILEEMRCQNKVEIFIELNKRIGMPFYIPIISLIVCYLLSSRKESRYFPFQKYIIFLAGFIVLILAEIMVRYSGKSTSYFLIYYLLPPSLIFLNYLNLIRIFKFENLAR